MAFQAAATVLIAGIVTGCAGMSDETMEDALAEPGKYNVYSCRDVENAMLSTAARVAELEQLMSRAAQGTGGSVMGAVAYGTEYKQGRAQLRALKAAAAEKQCVINSDYLSRRSLY